MSLNKMKISLDNSVLALFRVKKILKDDKKNVAHK